jgi:hypothetical protein
MLLGKPAIHMQKDEVEPLTLQNTQKLMSSKWLVVTNERLRLQN